MSLHLLPRCWPKKLWFHPIEFWWWMIWWAFLGYPASWVQLELGGIRWQTNRNEHHWESVVWPAMCCTFWHYLWLFTARFAMLLDLGVGTQVCAAGSNLLVFDWQSGHFLRAWCGCLGASVLLHQQFRVVHLQFDLLSEVTSVCPNVAAAVIVDVVFRLWRARMINIGSTLALNWNLWDSRVVKS